MKPAPIELVLTPIARNTYEALCRVAEGLVDSEDKALFQNFLASAREDFRWVDEELAAVDLAVEDFKNNEDIDVDRSPVRVSPADEGVWVSAYVWIPRDYLREQRRKARKKQE